MMRKAFVYRLFTNKTQERVLNELLETARLYYNAALQERRDAWQRGISLNYYRQSEQLKQIRTDNPWCAKLNYSATQDVLRRVDKTYKAFFRRVESGQKAGYPRFKARGRFNSIVFPSYGDGVRLAEKLYIQNVGKLRVKLHRPIEGMVKTVNIKRECGRWYAIFSCELPDIHRVPHGESIGGESIGIDVGLTCFASLSNGEHRYHPRYLKAGLAKLRRCQRKVARRKKGGANRHKAVKILQKAHAHIQHQRANFQHKESRKLANSYRFIAAEQLNIKGMVRNHRLAQSISDAGWGYFLSKLAYKVEETGGRFIQVNPNGTSQQCSQCGVDVPKTLADRIHSCPYCGLAVDRDVNAARNILRLGLSLWDKTREDTPSVSQEAVCLS